jgi:hypothetical protein
MTKPAIVEESVDALCEINIHPKHRPYPQSPEPDLPCCFFVSSWVGTRGSGKTYSCCHMLKMYDETGMKFEGHTVPQRVILVQPIRATTRTSRC